MKTHLLTKLTKAAALVALAVGSSSAYANTSANTTIFNKVDVSYEALNGVKRTATDAVSLTINYVDSKAIVTASELVDGTTTGIHKTVFAIDATSNGASDYTLTQSFGSKTNIKNESYNVYSITDPTDADSTGAFDGNITLGSGVIVGIDTATKTVYFPAGTLSAFGANDFVVVHSGVNSYTFRVSGTPDNGTVPNYDEDTDVYTPEEQASMVLVPYGYADTASGDAAFAALVEGDVLGERKYVRVDTTAENTSTTENATLDIVLNVVTTGGEATDPVTETLEFGFTNVTVTKKVKLSSESTYSDTIPAVNPGTVLDYQIVVTVGDDTAGASPTDTSTSAKLVVVEDVLPLYTKYDETSATNLAVTYDATVDTDDESGTNTAGVVTGDKIHAVYVPVDDKGTATIADDDPAKLVINLGTRTDATMSNGGGTMEPGDSVTITYSVTVE
ncbi:hypothetical protein [Thalassotalea maritima]|uniref:hypothetical protein n=1 Tax=Thalassotalea maritima TaxID=3242416 RepID=UPI0035279191